MTFFYSGLGIIIFSSIFLITKHNLLFSNNSFHSDYYNNEYVNSRTQKMDRYLLSFLKQNKDELGYGDDICFNLKSIVNSSGLIKKDEFKYQVFPDTLSTNYKLVGSCVLTNGTHRILIKRKSDDLNKYLLNSCLLLKDQVCSFEKNN